MIAGFRTKWPKEMGEWAGKPTRFTTKVISCLHYDLKLGSILNEYLSPNANGFNSKSQMLDEINALLSKKHTIREDAGNRWKVENNIHFFINVRKRDMFQFAPVIKVKLIQTIEIIHSGESWRMPWVMIDGNIQTAVEIEKLAINDGFESTKQFFAWFSKDFSGKIIHWTDLKY